MADQQAQDTLTQSHKIAKAAGDAHISAISHIHGALVKAAQAAGAQGTPPPDPSAPGGPAAGGPGGMPSAEDLVNQDPAAAADLADGIIKALHGLIMSYAQPAGNGMPVAPPDVGGENIGY
jgi:hypothetical protein